MAEIAVEGAEMAAPEVEAVGSKVASEAEAAGSKLVSRFAPKAEAEAATTAGPISQGTMNRLMDVGTGVMIGQSLSKSDTGNTAAEGATRTLAAVQQPPGVALAAAYRPPAVARLGPVATGGASRMRDSKGRFVRGGASSGSVNKKGRRLGGDDDEIVEEYTYTDVSSYASPVTGGEGPTIVIAPRPFSEKIQIAILIVLAVIIIAVVVLVAVKKPGAQGVLWTGLFLGALAGGTVVIGSKVGRPKAG